MKSGLPPTVVVSAKPTRSYSLCFSLVQLVTACILPAAFASAVVVTINYRLQHDQTLHQTEMLANQVASALERELSALESGLKVLATTPQIVRGDLAAFYDLAAEAVRAQIVYSYVVTDRDGRQHLNTVVPWGEPLPESGTPDKLQRVFTERRPVVADLFEGPITGRPVLTLGVPVERNGDVVYSLNIGLSPERIQKLLTDQSLPQDWHAIVQDSTDTVIASSSSQAPWTTGDALPEVLRGSPTNGGTAVRTAQLDALDEMLLATRAVGGYDWSVTIIAPRSGFTDHLRTQVFWIGAGTLLALFLGGLLALRIARRVVAAVKGLNEAARAIGTERPVVLPNVRLQETDAVTEAIVHASRTAAEIQHMAHHDALTGLANRWLFDELLQHEVASALRRGGPLVVLAVDLDGFKTVNDLYGHAAGDRVLQEVATRIQSSLRSADAVARMGGDEFSVLLADSDEPNARQTAARLLARLSEPYTGIDCPISASIGGAVFRGQGDTPQALSMRADDCMYAAKRGGKNRVCFDLDAPTRQ